MDCLIATPNKHGIMYLRIVVLNFHVVHVSVHVHFSFFVIRSGK